MANRRDVERRQWQEVDPNRKAEAPRGTTWKPTSYTIPEGVESFRWRQESHTIDIVQYVCKLAVYGGDNKIIADVGQLYDEKTMYVHRKIGPDNGDHCCLRKTFHRKKCPVCDRLNQLLLGSKSKEESKKLFGAFGEKERQLFKVWDRTDKDSRDKGVQLYEGSYYMGFGELLTEKLNKFRRRDRDHPFLRYYSYKEGFSLEVSCKEDKYQGRPFWKPVDIDFVERKHEIPDDFITEICLDDLPIELSYEELAEVLENTGSGGGRKQEEEERSPKRTSTYSGWKKGEEEEEEDEDKEEKIPAKKNGHIPRASDFDIVKGSTVLHDEYGECEVVHISADGTSLKLRDSDDDIHSPINAEDVKLVKDDEDEDDKPKNRVKKQSKEPPKKGGKGRRQEEEDDDDDDQDEEPEDEEEEEEDMPRRGKTKGKK